MTVGELKSIIANEKLPDSAPVLVPGSDHSYQIIHEVETEATHAGRGHYFEYFGAEHLESGEVRIKALVLR